METRGRKKLYIDWTEYKRLKKEEGLRDKDIARIFGISANYLCVKKREQGLI